MRKRNINILALVITMFFVGKIYAQQTEAWSSIDSNAIIIGDQVKYKLGITTPKNAIIAWPVFVDTLSSNIEILNKSKIDTVYSDSHITLQQQLIITSFDSGYFEIKPIDFNFYFPNDTTIYTTSTNLLFLQVHVPVVDTAQAFKPIAGPIKEPYTFAEILPWIIAVTAVIIIITLLILYIIKRRKQQPVFKRKQKPALPAHVQAINKLEKLRLAKVWQSGKLKKYYTELTDITREYMVNRYHFDALEMTTFEIISELNDLSINEKAMEKLETVLQLSDMVKFAKAVPTALENDLGLTHCIDFVNETKKVEEPIITGSKEETNLTESK